MGFRSARARASELFLRLVPEERSSASRRGGGDGDGAAFRCGSVAAFADDVKRPCIARLARARALFGAAWSRREKILLARSSLSQKFPAFSTAELPGEEKSAGIRNRMLSEKKTFRRRESPHPFFPLFFLLLFFFPSSTAFFHGSF
jgi:hypothetical protein